MIGDPELPEKESDPCVIEPLIRARLTVLARQYLAAL
jgi:hypothetical protein